MSTVLIKCSSFLVCARRPQRSLLIALRSACTHRSPLHQKFEVENRKYEKYIANLQSSISDIERSIRDEYLATSSDDCQSEDMHDVSGPYEYMFRRLADQNHANLYRQPAGQTGENKSELVVDVDKLGTFYSELITVNSLKLSPDHSITAFVLSLLESNRQLLLVKHIERNVVCEVNFPGHICPVDVEIASASSSHGMSMYVTSTEDGVRPSQVLRLNLSYREVFGKTMMRTTVQRMRTMRVSEHAPVVTMELCLHEADPAYFLDIMRSKDDSYILVHHHSKKTSQVTAFDARTPNSDAITIKEKVVGEQWFVNHVPGWFIVARRQLNLSIRESTDDAHPKNELSIFKYSSQGAFTTYDATKSKCTLLWPTTPDPLRVYSLDDFDIFEHRMVVYGRDNRGDIFVQLIRVSDSQVLREYNSDSLQALSGYRPASLTPGANANYQSRSVRFSVSSPLLPEAAFELDLEAGEIVQSKLTTSPLLTECISSDTEMCTFSSNVVHVKAHDGYTIPMLICSPGSREDSYKVGPADGNTPRPTVLFAYGAYGVCLPMNYRPEIAVMLSRGWIVAFAQVRGGGELGKVHHDQGSGMSKWNTFSDYRACAEYLISQGYSTPSLLCASGHSAGGLIIGVMINNFSHLFAAVVMRNPFLDIYHTVQDPSSALVIHEYDEWGNTSRKHTSDHDTSEVEASTAQTSNKVLKYIRSYAPCENVSNLVLKANQKSLPRCLITVGLLDDRVSPKESLRWVQLIRERCELLNSSSSSVATDSALVFVRTQDCGHDGSSSLQEQFRDHAIDIAFLESGLRE